MKKQKDIFNPTPAQVKYRNRKWAEALMTSVKAKNSLVGKNGESRCCLGVACDVANEMFPSSIKSASEFNDEAKGVPDEKVKNFFGWKSNIPKLKIPNDLISAVELNDSGIVSDDKTIDVTHKQISECVLNTFVRPKNPIWELNKI